MDKSVVTLFILSTIFYIVQTDATFDRPLDESNSSRPTVIEIPRNLKRSDSSAFGFLQSLSRSKRDRWQEPRDRSADQRYSYSNPDPRQQQQHQQQYNGSPGYGSRPDSRPTEQSPGDYGRHRHEHDPYGERDRYPQYGHQQENRQEPEPPVDRTQVPDRDPYAATAEPSPYYGQGQHNLGLEIEILRFTNENAVLSNGRPCSSSEDVDCNYRFSGYVDFGSLQHESPATVIATVNGRNYAEVNMRTKRFLCGAQEVPSRANLQIAVTASSGRQKRQEQDAENRYEPAEDQYSRDRYESRNHAASGRSSGGSGQLVNMFDCIMEVPKGQETVTAEWKTTTCTPKHGEYPMELMFRYIAYSLEAGECNERKTEHQSNAQWSSIAFG